MGIMHSDATETTAVLGQRIRYLSKDSAVRAHVLARLATAHPFIIAASVKVGNLPTINLLTDSMDTFVGRLRDLLGEEEAQNYVKDDKELDPDNRDTGDNRNRFFGWWNVTAGQVRTLRRQLREALEALLPLGEFEVRWRPDLGPNDPAGAITAEVNGDPRLLVFHTREDAVERVA